MKLELGKTYTCRDGSTFTAEDFTGKRGTYAVQGVTADGGVSWRSLNGRFSSRPHPRDVVAEAK